MLRVAQFYPSLSLGHIFQTGINIALSIHRVIRITVFTPTQCRTKRTAICMSQIEKKIPRAGHLLRKQRLLLGNADIIHLFPQSIHFDLACASA